MDSRYEVTQGSIEKIPTSQFSRQKCDYNIKIKITVGRSTVEDSCLEASVSKLEAVKTVGV